MTKQLSDMSLEELWELFPISLTEHQEDWGKWYEEEADHLGNLLTPECEGSSLRIDHIGSTAIDGIWAKPIIDILIQFPNALALNTAKDILISAGYICMSENKNRASLNKGYTANGFAERVFHIHLHLIGDDKEILFRDYLRSHPDVASEYEKLKLALWKEFEHDRDGYTEAKTEFITQCLEQAAEDDKTRTRTAGQTHGSCNICLVPPTGIEPVSQP